MSSQSVTPRNRRKTTNIEPEVFEACWRLYQRGETDLLEGGVPSLDIANAIGRSRGATADALLRLKKQGAIEVLRGADPETYRARRSFAPAALVDGGEQR